MSLISWRSSKGQVQQAFIFLMAILVIIATIYLGMRMLGMFTTTSCDLGDAQFKTDLSRLLDEYSRFGSRAEVSIDAPCDAQQLCFVDHASMDATFINPDDPVMTQIINQGIETNLFLRTEEGLMEAGYDERIQVSTPGRFICVESNLGKFTFRVNGRGRFVEIV